QEHHPPSPAPGCGLPVASQARSRAHEACPKVGSTRRGAALFFWPDLSTHGEPSRHRLPRGRSVAPGGRRVGSPDLAAGKLTRLMPARLDPRHNASIESEPMATRVSIGLDKLDSMLGGGLLPGTLTVVYGATGIGKTHLGLGFAHHGRA